MLRPAGTTNHVAGGHIPTVLKPGQTAAATTGKIKGEDA